LAKQEVSNILLLGESGTGKGVLAKFIHKNSPRSRESFIHINCAALPENLMEAELFGYEKGAFTGACEKGKVGLFELAESGTLFLDEIGDMPLSIQAKLLTYLDDKQILRLGGITPIKVNCTIIAATNKDLLTRVEQKKFRLDLYYRLNSFTLHIPPLRDRKEDILALIQHFVKQYNDTYGTQRRISSVAFERLQNYAFPGNVRELSNIIKKAVVLSEGELIDGQVLGCLPSGPKSPDFDCLKPTINSTISLEDQIASLEKDILMDAINRQKTTRRIASFLGTSQSSIIRKIKKHGLRLGAEAS
jgi:transcriptional regulator with PAS, ATPase and Fis domain